MKQHIESTKATWGGYFRKTRWEIKRLGVYLLKKKKGENLPDWSIVTLSGQGLVMRLHLDDVSSPCLGRTVGSHIETPRGMVRVEVRMRDKEFRKFFNMFGSKGLAKLFPAGG